MPSPSREHPGLIVHGRAPFNAEPPLAALRAHHLTPQGLFYVRSHGNIPDLDAASHRVAVGGRVARPLALSPEDVRTRFAPRTVRAVMQCAGNRRADLGAVRPVKGDPWAGGAIGCADWTGASLADVLDAAGAAADARHVAFTSADICQARDGGAAYGVSIPIDKARDPDVLVAYAMNGEPLSAEHGFPLRLVVPGWAGVRSPKWLTAVTVQDRPSDAFQQAADYKLYPPDMRAETEDLSRGFTIEAMPLTSAIAEPAPGAALPAGPVAVRGYAVASGRAVVRVDLSGDGGREWVQAAIEDHGAARWGWIFWSGTLVLPPGAHEICARAWDAAGQTQPARPDDTWNFKGYLSSAWHRVRVTAA